MNKKAFTLIELLVVIAIIAILAAILFPVFAQAKSAAKKAAAISGQKQIGASILMYMNDSDDIYPRSEGCAPRSSLNAALNAATYTPPNGNGCSTPGPYPWRMNHYAWQKWVLPYAKSVEVFVHPGRAKLDTTSPRQWSENGQIMGGFAINLALTGAINTFERSDTAPGRLRNSWIGGSQANLQDVSAAMLTFEIGNPTINFAPVALDPTNNPLSIQTIYPPAVKEFWKANYMKSTGTCTYNTEADPRATIGGAITVGFADGSAKALVANEFLARTPSAAEFGVALSTAMQCGTTSGTLLTSATPNTNLNYPFWGLYR